MQKTLTRVEACEAPSPMHALARAPLSVMVRAKPAANAPPVRCRQKGQAATPVEPQVAGAVAQAASLEHALARVEGDASGPNWAEVPLPSLQKPQKTNDCGPTGPDGSGMSTEVLVCVPVESANPIGKLPMKAAEVGGQSWLVGKAPPRLAEAPGVQGWPVLVPALQVVPGPGVAAHRGQGMSPSVGPVR